MTFSRRHALSTSCTLALLLAGSAQAGDVELTPTLQLQSRVTVWDQDEASQADPYGYGDPEDDVGIGIERARVGMNGRGEHLMFDVTVGTTAPYDGRSEPGPVVDIVSAYAASEWTLGPGDLELGLGTRRVPFSRERMQSSRNLLFQERAVNAQWLGPTWGLGATADYGLENGLKVRTGVYNGGGSLFADNNDGLMMSARVEWANGETYDPRRTEPGTFGVGAGALQNWDVSSTTTGYAADVFARLGPIQLQAEGAMTSITPGGTSEAPPPVTDPTTRLGASGTVSYIVDRDDDRLELGARFAWLDDNRALENNGDVGIAHVGGTWWDVMPGLDVGAAYVHRVELGGRSVANNSARLWAQVRYPLPSKDDDTTLLAP